MASISRPKMAQTVSNHNAYNIHFYGIVGSDPIVKVSDVLVQGSWKKSSKGKNYATFYGIPYAKPPVGELRFKNPEAFSTWSGVWDASAPRSKCLQYDPFAKEVYGSEDCLYLNVRTPTPDPEEPLPVLVYFHGGAFMYGEGAPYGAARLMDRNLVLVTLNYRLGPLGFLSTGDAVCPGNLGLKDQAFAIRWVKDNIRSFGGNPESITLIGQSAGGASVHYHFLSQLSQDLFTRGIAMSGSAFAPWAQSVRPVHKAKTLAGMLACPTNSSAAMIDCLMKKPGEDIANAQAAMLSWKVKFFTVFTPTVEPEGTKDAFLTEHPYLASQSSMKKAPLITSVTSEEGLYPAAAYQKQPDLLPDLENHWEELSRSIFEYNDTLPLPLHTTVAAKIKDYYLQNKSVSQETFPELVKALSDRLFAVPVSKLAQISAAARPTYFYQYRFTGEKSLANVMANNQKNYGSAHADDLIHIFFLPGLDCTTPGDLMMTEAMLNMVSSFAATGSPRIDDQIEWQPVSPSQLNYLEISTPDIMAMKSNTDFGYRSFWDNLGFIENEKHHSIIDETF